MTAELFMALFWIGISIVIFISATMVLCLIIEVVELFKESRHRRHEHLRVQDSHR